MSLTFIADNLCVAAVGCSKLVGECCSCDWPVRAVHFLKEPTMGDHGHGAPSGTEKCFLNFSNPAFHLAILSHSRALRAAFTCPTRPNATKERRRPACDAAAVSMSASAGAAQHSGRTSAGLSSPPFRTVLVWFRRDLRLDDNPALIAAVQAATTVVIPSFCLTVPATGHQTAQIDAPYIHVHAWTSIGKVMS